MLDRREPFVEGVPVAAIVRSRFPLLFASVAAVVIAIGFARTFYLRFLFDLPPMTLLVHLHGAIFTAWFVLVIAQVRFVAKHRVDLHRVLGVVGIALAVLVIASTLATLFASTTVDRVRPDGLSPAQATISGFTSTLLFSVLFALGIAYRRRPSVHRRFMLLSLVPILTPGMNRLLTLVGLDDVRPILTPLIAATFVVWCLIHDWRKYRVVHPVYAVGGLLVVLSWPAKTLAGRSEWYQPIANWAAEVGASMN
jgi:hypothetical protein